MMKNRITNALNTHLESPEIIIIDESSKHAGHSGNPNYAIENTHLNIKIVSPSFCDLSRLARHRRVNDIMAPFFDEGLHALTLDLKTPDEV